MDRVIFLQVLASGVIHALWNFAAKRSSGNLAVNWLAQIVGAVALLPFALIENSFSTLGPLGFKCILAAGLIQSFYFWLLSAAYRTGEISVVYPIARGLGIGGSAIVGIIFFADIVSSIGGAGIVAIAGGTLFIGYGQMRQRGADFRPVMWSVLIALSLTVGSYVDKTGVTGAPPVAYLCLVYIVSSVLSAPLFVLRNRSGITQALAGQKWLVTIVGTGAAFSYLIILYALRSGPLGYILAVREVAVILGAILGFLFLSERIHASKIFGIIAILIGIIMIKSS